MARERTLKVVIAGDADKLDRELKRAGGSLDKFGKQTKLTASVTSKGYSAMRLGATGAAAGVAGLGAEVYRSITGFRGPREGRPADRGCPQVHGRRREPDREGSRLARDALERKTGVDGDQIQSGENMLLTFTNVRNEVGKGNDIFNQATSTVLDMSVALGQDTKSSAIQLGKALNDPVKGVTALQRVGVTFTAQQKDQIKTLVDSGNTLDAQKIILRELDKEFGGSAAEQGRLRRSHRHARTASRTPSGRRLPPIAEKGAKKVSKFVQQMQDGTGQGGRFVDKLKDVWQETKPIVTWIGRATKNVAEFTADHPGLAKLVAGIVGVGVAVKGLRFVSAATGFSTLLKAGGVAAKGLKAILKRGGAAAGEAAAANAAEGMAGHLPASMSARSGRISATMKSAGKLAGRAFGITAGLIAASEIASALAKGGVNPSHDYGKGIGAGILGKLNDIGNAPVNAWAKLLGIKRAGGGMIPGAGDRDTVPILATPGEHVTRKAIVQKFGPTVFADINDGRLDPRRGYDIQRFTSGGIVSRANKMDSMHLPYLWGGGHGVGVGQIDRRGEDCSGAVSYALGVSPRVSGQFTSFGKPGPGSANDTKVYANAEHVFAVFNGRGWGTSRENPGGGPGWLSYSHRSGFTIRHLDDGALKGKKATTGNKQEASESGVTAGRFLNGGPAPTSTKSAGSSSSVSVFERDSADADLGIAEAQARTVGDVVGGSPAAIKQADAVSAKRKVVGARIQKIRAALKKQGLRPVTRVRLTNELADLLGEHAQLGEQGRDLRTPPAADDAGDPNQALIDAVDANTQAQEDARDAALAVAEAEKARTDELAGLRAAIEQQTALAKSAVAIQGREALAAVGALISGELGQKVAQRAMMPGTGQLSRF